MYQRFAALGVAAFVAGLCCLATAIGPPTASSDILVVVDSANTETTHSILLQSLISLGFGLTVVSASSSAADLSLVSPGAGPTEYRYGGVMLLCPMSTTVATVLPVTTLERFVDSGGSLFLAAAPGFTPYVAAVARSIGVDMDEPTSYVIDHQSPFEPLDDGSRTFIKVGGRTPSEHLFGAAHTIASGDIVFSGPGATLFSDNELVDAVLWGSGSAYSGTPRSAVTDSPHEAGTATVLAAALSTRVASRAVYFGSFDALSDAVFGAANPAHRVALCMLAAWTFGHRGVLRTRNVLLTTKRAEAAEYDVEAAESAGGGAFRVKDDIDFSVDIQEWNGAEARWGAFSADDVQVEFVMLNPWVRARLSQKRNGDNSTYTAKIPVPDQIGIYKVVVAYHRPGVSGLKLSHVAPVRPYLHNEYPRFIPMAYPYYAASFAMLLSGFLLGIVLLFGSAPTSVVPVGEIAALQATVGAGTSGKSRKRE
jgi:oligosaccharyltransferase complex subunit beta